MKKVSFVMALICAVAVFGGCAGKDKSNPSSDVSLAPITVPQSIAVSKLDASEEWVYDSAEFEGTSHHIPQFNVNSQEISEINKEIVKNCKEIAENGNKRNISYSYILVKNCLLSVHIEIIENGWFYKSYAYNVSLGDGSLIEDARTMAAYCGISDEEYRISAATAVTNEYVSLFEAIKHSNTSGYKENLLKNQSEERTKTYTGYINERKELCFCGEMYGIEGNLKNFAATSVTMPGIDY